MNMWTKQFGWEMSKMEKKSKMATIVRNGGKERPNDQQHYNYQNSLVWPDRKFSIFTKIFCSKIAHFLQNFTKYLSTFNIHPIEPLFPWNDIFISIIQFLSIYICVNMVNVICPIRSILTIYSGHTEYLLNNPNITLECYLIVFTFGMFSI